MRFRNEQKERLQRLDVVNDHNGFEIHMLVLKVFAVGVYRDMELMILVDGLAS